MRCSLKLLALTALSTPAFAQSFTLTPVKPVKLSVEALHAECPVTLVLSLEKEAPRVSSLTLSLEVAKLTGGDAKALQRFVFAAASHPAVTFSSTEIKLKPIKTVLEAEGRFLQPSQPVRSFELEARGKLRLAGQERVIDVEGLLSLSGEEVTVRLSVPVLRRSEFGLSTELPRPKVELILIPMLFLSAHPD